MNTSCYTSGPWEITQVAAEDGYGPALVVLTRDGDFIALISDDTIPSLLTVLMSYLGIARAELEETES